MIKNFFKNLTKFEIALWIISVAVIVLSFLFTPIKDYLALTASLIGVTSLIFLAKGNVIGQILVIIFSLLYGIISFFLSYYGEMLTYLCMTAPMAVAAMISWFKHPYKNATEVKVGSLNGKKIILLILFTVIVTVVFYFVLRTLNTANLIVSTISVATSFAAVYLTFLRSPFYAVAYALNDVVLIVLWILASVINIANISMVMCFVMFFLNDLYGFYNWQKMKKNQREATHDCA